MESIAESESVLEQKLSKKRIAYLESRAQEMEDSIRYAGNLQKSILPHPNLFRDSFSDAFVLYQPKDIVGGDFYWIATFGDDIYFAVGDCKGHGVPGALVNIAGNSILRQLINRQGLTEPGDILAELDKELIGLFNDHKTNGQTYDGMDVVLCKFNLKTNTACYCGAGRPLLRLRNGKLTEFKKGTASIGFNIGRDKQFKTECVDLRPGDQFYLFSDGYTDQFGGEKIKKFNRKRFRNLLGSIEEMDMTRQQKELEFTLQNWMGNHEQINDVCVLGIKI
ncbi:MAG: SpoIIE family protein phosphatase [Crocinitomicaceae bacterium]